MPCKPLAVTMGEPAGVGPELVAQSWFQIRHERAETAQTPFYCCCDPDFLSKRLSDAGFTIPLSIVQTAAEAVSVFTHGLPIVPLARGVVSGRAGSPSSADAAAVLESIERCVADVMSGQAGGVVTSPVQKETLYDAGFAFPGHTEFLGDLAERNGLEARPVMMLAAEELRVVPVTIHVPISAVPGLLTTEAIVTTGEIVARELVSKFGISNPRLVIAGLNPHAGEGGRIGFEDRDVVAPAVARLQALGIDARGPLAADTLFHAAARKTYDAALCMYHDQALIPIKTVAFDHAVNVTLGLPFIRTSPDHGTALSLAGTGEANPTSFIAAIAMAARMAARAR